MEWTQFEPGPASYRHWQLEVAGPVAKLTMKVDAAHPHKPGYELKLNSYDLSVDIELADITQRLRFEHPEVRVCVVGADLDRVFCSGANIYMLGASSHSFKVNFCKFTNETRRYLEDASAHSALKFLSACKGTTAGGGYELALACDEIMLVEDGNSAVSFPETPLLAVLPGTGGLTRLVDKRKVRRDRADVFCTLAEGIKGKRAKEWNLVDDVVPRSKWDEAVSARTQALVAKASGEGRAVGPAVKLPALAATVKDTSRAYCYVSLDIDNKQRTATLTVRAPSQAPQGSITAEGVDTWSLRAFRELDNALLHLRFDLPQIGTVLVRTIGDRSLVLAHDEALRADASGFAREVRLLQARVLRRLDNTAKSLFAVADSPESCFAGVLLEVALACDRAYGLIDAKEAIALQTGVANRGDLLTASGLSRLAVRFYGTPAQVEKVLAEGAKGPLSVEAAEALGLVTIAADDIDFADELRIAVEERASLSPDALTGMEASLRFLGPETMETKIFGRLSAWQNWIFTRANATGEQGALTLYGRPERPAFQFNRT
ncbi:MAG: benzoyl-CoA-dihydrodiol lyase [Myxococcales bacterium]|nr:benzoyl-CoA-dihydrodiol lyase [Myxococcales bacterium]